MVKESVLLNNPVIIDGWTIGYVCMVKQSGIFDVLTIGYA